MPEGEAEGVGEDEVDPPFPPIALAIDSENSSTVISATFVTIIFS
jgi:hypothetical protein